MNKFFCADASHDVLEDKIGSATYYQTYVFIEHPTPWHSQALESPGIPENLQLLAKELKSSHHSIRFLLMKRNCCLLNKRKTVLIYHQGSGDFCGGYQRHEFAVEEIEEVGKIVTDFLTGQNLQTIDTHENYQDVFVCVHGSHDVCCAKYGIPFYKKAVTHFSSSELKNVRMWQVSHFGGHRFAPTAITFPDGRYYGGLNLESLDSILRRSGSLEIFNQVYRGWSILPYELQVLERELMGKFGWEWFSYKITHQIKQQCPDKSWFQAEIKMQKPDNSQQTYSAEIIRDDQKTVYLKGSCQAKKAFLFVKYYVDNLQLVPDQSTDLDKQIHGGYPEKLFPLPGRQNPTSHKTQVPLS